MSAQQGWKHLCVSLVGVRMRASELLRQNMDVVLLLQVLQPQHLNLMLQPLYLRVELH